MNARETSPSQASGATRRPRLGAPIALVLALAYVAGFFVFLNHLPRTTPKSVQADGIVALTGGEERLNAATALFEKGVGRRLLITGVHPTTTKQALRILLHGARRFDCCVDLGFQATNTHGNAAEAAQWTRAHGYRSLVVVTADYHMPRSLLEFSARMPGVRLIAYPVASEKVDLRDWWHSPLAFAVLPWEYTKYLASATLNGLFPPARPRS
ncbi:MAG TPA: YdcF family protein [Rhizomicrobium sp.]